MSNRAVDLFDDPPWAREAPSDDRAARPSRAWLISTLVLDVLFAASMALPWFTSGETPPWTPFSHWLNLGWSPGTERWGLLLLALCAVLAVDLGLIVRTRRIALLVTLPLLAAVLVVMTFLEASAHLSVNPGPSLHADFGAWIGDCLSVCILICTAVGTIAAVWERLSQPH